jgi:hypothetical protein
MFFRGQRTPPDDTPDTMFPHLSRITADMLRDEALRELHRLGFTTTWRPDGYISATRGEETELIGLDMLRDEALRELAAQVHNLLDAMSHRIDPAELSEADFLRQLKVRLVAGDMLTPVSERDSRQFSLSTRPWTDDLVVSLVIDTPTTVMTLPDKTLEARGLTSEADLEDLWHAGYRNLWQELTEAEIDVNEIHGDDPGANFWVIESGSFFLASAVLFLDELLPDWAPDLDTEAGIMVSAPHRHLLLVRAVTSGQDLLAGINTVTSVAVAQFTENPGPVSPKLHLMREGAEVLPFTDITDNDDGQRVIQVYPDAYLMDRINEGRDED